MKHNHSEAEVAFQVGNLETVTLFLVFWTNSVEEFGVFIDRQDTIRQPYK